MDRELSLGLPILGRNPPKEAFRDTRVIKVKVGGVVFFAAAVAIAIVVAYKNRDKLFAMNEKK